MADMIAGLVCSREFYPVVQRRATGLGSPMDVRRRGCACVETVSPAGALPFSISPCLTEVGDQPRAGMLPPLSYPGTTARGNGAGLVIKFSTMDLNFMEMTIFSSSQGRELDLPLWLLNISLPPSFCV